MDILFLFGYCNDMRLKETGEPITKEVLECVKKTSACRYSSM